MSKQELEDVHESDTQILTAEYKDGQLQIVEVAPFDNEKVTDTDSQEQAGESPKYVQVLDSSQLDLLNLTLVRCEDSSQGYRLVSRDSSDGDNEDSDATVACVLNDDSEETDADSYVLVQGDQGPLVFLESSLPKSTPKKVEPKKPKIDMLPSELLEKAKALQKAKALMSQDRLEALKRGKGRKRKGDLPPAHELLSSPNFKLFLYSCKMCPFKCNAIKDMTAHKASVHSGSKYRSETRAPPPRVPPPRAPTPRSTNNSNDNGNNLQCAACPYKTYNHIRLMKHVKDVHSTETAKSITVQLDTEQVAAADVLVCGACGFESASRPVFRKHIERQHGATTS